MVSLHEEKEEGTTLDGGWKKTTLTSHCSCVFFSACIAVLASNHLTAASSGGTNPGAVKKKEQPLPSILESHVSNFLCLLL